MIPSKKTFRMMLPVCSLIGFRSRHRHLDCISLKPLRSFDLSLPDFSMNIHMNRVNLFKPMSSQNIKSIENAGIIFSLTPLES